MAGFNYGSPALDMLNFNAYGGFETKDVLSPLSSLSSRLAGTVVSTPCTKYFPLRKGTAAAGGSPLRTDNSVKFSLHFSSTENTPSPTNLVTNNVLDAILVKRQISDDNSLFGDDSNIAECSFECSQGAIYSECNLSNSQSQPERDPTFIFSSHSTTSSHPRSLRRKGVPRRLPLRTSKTVPAIPQTRMISTTAPLFYDECANLNASDCFSRHVNEQIGHTELIGRMSSQTDNVLLSEGGSSSRDSGFGTTSLPGSCEVNLFGAWSCSNDSAALCNSQSQGTRRPKRLSGVLQDPSSGVSGHYGSDSCSLKMDDGFVDFDNTMSDALPLSGTQLLSADSFLRRRSSNSTALSSLPTVRSCTRSNSELVPPVSWRQQKVSENDDVFITSPHRASCKVPSVLSERTEAVLLSPNRKLVSCENLRTPKRRRLISGESILPCDQECLSRKKRKPLGDIMTCLQPDEMGMKVVFSNRPTFMTRCMSESVALDANRVTQAIDEQDQHGYSRCNPSERTVIPLVSSDEVAQLITGHLAAIKTGETANDSNDELLCDGAEEYFGAALGGHSGVKRFRIFDCRYPYEYQGGHIVGAVNCYRADFMLTKLLDSALTREKTCKLTSPTKRQPTALIFHCEFSSERAPTLAKLLRSRDRNINAHRYPRLFYPEIYVLQKGYKHFFELHSSLCNPMAYRKMSDVGFRHHLKRYKSESQQIQRQLSMRVTSCSPQQCLAGIDVAPLEEKPPFLLRRSYSTVNFR